MAFGIAFGWLQIIAQTPIYVQQKDYNDWYTVV
jgi:hypothetical protein